MQAHSTTSGGDGHHEATGIVQPTNAIQEYRGPLRPSPAVQSGRATAPTAVDPLEGQAAFERSIVRKHDPNSLRLVGFSVLWTALILAGLLLLHMLG
ncbi:MAG: hypothetical protein NZO58_04720 [Gemmataceae bacterium]|nr:hypothetical protein [Gemmataceae bacterium]